MTTFAALGLSEPLLRAVEALGYAEPTPIQVEAIPTILRGSDVWASARTGSGKTAAFGLPIVERLSRSPSGSPRALRALVLEPTRELAAQVAAAFDGFASQLPRPLKTCLAVGGVSINPQMMALRGGADIVVATPGRLLDLVAQNAVRLSTVETLVLDEADRMLSLGFAEELGRVVALLPKRRQSLLLSATLPPSVLSLAGELLRDPTRINVDAGATPPAALLEQRVILVDTGKRTLLLRHLLETSGWPKVLVFVASQHGADHVAQKLSRAHVTVVALHGGLSQGARSQALADLTSGCVQVLIATDLAARGIDIASLPAVVNYDLPRSPADYVHRVGRTARAGEPGVALSFVSADSAAHFELIERRNGLRLSREQIPGFEPVDVGAPVRDAHGGVKGKRPSKKDKLRAAAAAAKSRSDGSS